MSSPSWLLSLGDRGLAPLCPSTPNTVPSSSACRWVTDPNAIQADAGEEGGQASFAVHGAVLRSSHLSRPDKSFLPTCLSQGTSVSSFRTSFDFTFFSKCRQGISPSVRELSHPPLPVFQQSFLNRCSLLRPHHSSGQNLKGLQAANSPWASWSIRSTHTPSFSVPNIKHALHLSPSAPLPWANGSCPQHTGAVLGLHILGACLKGPQKPPSLTGLEERGTLPLQRTPFKNLSDLQKPTLLVGRVDPDLGH